MLMVVMSNGHGDPLHGITLKMMLTELQVAMGWEGLATRINIHCFSHNPSLKSSLNFLRRTPWAREKVEQLYVKTKGISLSKKAKPTKVSRSVANVWTQSGSVSTSNTSSQPTDPSNRTKTSKPSSAKANPWAKGRGNSQ